MTVNQVTLVGRLGADPEFRVFGDGQGVAKFSLATDRRGANKPDWHRVSVFGQSGIFAKDFLKKGDMVCVQGRIEYREHDGKWYTDIVSNRLTALTPKAVADAPDLPF